MDHPRLSDPPQAPTPTSVGLYFRPGGPTSMRREPGIMLLDDGRLSFRTNTQTVFDVDTGRASARLTTFGTLVVTADGDEHSFVTGPYAGAGAPAFSDRQVQALAALHPGQLPGLGERTLSRHRIVGEQRRAFGRIVSWADALRRAGLPVRIRSRRFARSQLVIAAWAVPILAVVIVGAFQVVPGRS